MKSLAIGVLVVLSFAAPAQTITRTCTSQMVTLGICRATSDVAICVAASTIDPDTTGPLLAPSALVVEAFALLENWQSPTPCTSEMVGSAICTAGQIGTLVPITKAQFVDMRVRQFILQKVRLYLKQQQVTAAQVAADAAADPDIGQ